MIGFKFDTDLRNCLTDLATSKVNENWSTQMSVF